jgi:hypothetical protein
MPEASLSDRDDQILTLTRAVAVIVVPFLLVAFGLIYMRPELAAGMFAWPVKPELTAMLLGAAYLGGVVFFCTLLVSRAWHRIALGIPPVATFASLLLVTTVIHRDLFSFDRVAGWTWTLIYIVAPPLVVAAWWLNRRRDPGPGPSDSLVPRTVTRPMVIVGIAAIGLAVLLYAVPDVFIGVWPWRLTPLSARVIAPMLCLPGILAIGIALDRRRSALRSPLMAQAVAIVAMLGAMWARQADLTGPAASVAIAWLVVAGSLAGTVALLVAFREPAVAGQGG